MRISLFLSDSSASCHSAARAFLLLRTLSVLLLTDAATAADEAIKVQ